MPRLRGVTAPALWAILTALPALVTTAAQAQDAADIELGRQLFLTDTNPPCAACHTLAEAGATGTVGPDLDELKPSEDRIRAAIEKGVGIMPAFEDLTPEQVDALTKYVSQALAR